MKGFEFIHIPKCAGSSVAEALGFKGCQHKTASSTNKEHFRFTFVRNPFDRIVSSYNYLTGGFGNAGDQKFGETLPKTFDEFVRNGINLEWLHFKPMLQWLDAEINYVGKYENLDSDFSDITKLMGIEATLKHINKSSHKHFSEYYDDELREIVGGVYAEDIEYFGYEFGE